MARAAERGGGATDKRRPDDASLFRNSTNLPGHTCCRRGAHSSLLLLQSQQPVVCVDGVSSIARSQEHSLDLVAISNAADALADIVTVFRELCADLRSSKVGEDFNDGG